MKALDRELVRALHESRNRFGHKAATQKMHLLARCAERALTNARIVRDYHESLHFLAAYPDHRHLAATVDSELLRLADAMPRLAQSRSGTKVLHMSGLPGTVLESKYSIDLVRWLVDRFPEDVDIAWEDGSAGSDLDEFLGALILPLERDSLRSRDLTTRDWLRLAAGNDPARSSGLSWLLRKLRTLDCDPDVLDHIFDALDLSIRWRLADAGATKTSLRFPPRKPYYQRAELKRSFSTPRLLNRPLPPVARQSSRSAVHLIDIARAALTVRDRETDPVTYANPSEVTLFSLERGIDIAMYGMRFDRRLPIESYFGYVAARNRVPVAYGGAWIFNHRAEIGIHLFDTFRGGESSYLFAQILRVYGRHFHIHRFQVDPYQFGADNPDAIRSGAFWFYHRLGFRPVDAKLRQLADEEWSSIQADRAHRTTASLLRRFATSPIELQVPGSEPRGGNPPALTEISQAVMKTIGRQFDGDRPRAEQWARRRVKRLLRPGRMSGWADDEREAFNRLCPLVAILPGLESWPTRDQSSMVSIMRAKGSRQERDYVLAIQRHEKFQTSLRELVSTLE